MNPVFHLRLAGGLLIFLAAMHLFLPRRFHWREELGRLSLFNRQVFYVHTFFICLVLVMMGALSAFAADSLMQPTHLGCLVLGAFAVFWLIRLAVQLFVFDPRLWRGQRFNTAMHCLLTLLWTYFTTVYAGAAWLQSQGLAAR